MSNKLDFSKELIGHRALVTGGSRGIGAAIAQRLLDAGAKVVVAARTRSDDTPAAATFVSGDVTTSDSVQGIATKALAAMDQLRSVWSSKNCGMDQCECVPLPPTPPSCSPVADAPFPGLCL